jgi:four helix bundle protein
MGQVTSDMEKISKMEEDLGYKKLNAHIKANELVLFVYQVTRNFPKEEIFGLTSQMRRSAISIAANIVEGYGRRTKKDKLQFLYIARGSYSELEYYINLSVPLHYIDEKTYLQLNDLRREIGRLLTGFIRFLEKN